VKDLARQLLDRQLTRRAFVSRVTSLGVAAGAAAGFAHALDARAGAGQSGGSPSAGDGRILHDATGGEIMAEFLIDWNVPYVFGLAGSEEVGFLDALVDRVQLQYVQGLHESSVMAMADGYARASGQTAFVNVHSDAGTAYALGQIANAFRDRVPVVITAGGQATGARGQNVFLEAPNLAQLPRDYTRWTWDVLSADTIPEVLRRAFIFARVPPGGPTFVTVSKDLWERKVKRAEIIPRPRSQPDEALHPDPAAVSRAAELLREARFPVIVAGRELNAYGGADDLRAIAELLGAPVFSDLFASHSPITFPSFHPLYAGFFAEDESFPKNYDVFWSSGGTMFTAAGATSAPIVPRSTRVIHATVDTTELGRTYPVDVPIAARVDLTTKAVLSELRRRGVSGAAAADRRREVERYTQARRAALEQQARRSWNNQPISIERLSSEVNRLIDSDAIVVTELISEEQVADAYFELSRDGRGRRHFTTAGGCLGWGVANAIGAKIAQPDRQVVALVGDGSFQFGVQALWTAVRYEVPVAVVVWNNGAYQANRKFLHQYGGRAAATGRYPGCSIDSPPIDHVSIAKGYGVEAERVDDPAGLAPSLQRCFDVVRSGRPFVLDVRIAKRYGGADSTWFDFFSVARKLKRQT
jgi:thiamine pyrophosphate-dependent acetolactate synthase large subunit-like protein